MSTVQVLSPVGSTWTPPKKRPPRPTALAGLRPGILENSKANAQLLMEAMVELLGTAHGLAPVTIGHKGVTLPPSSKTVAMLKESCDFVLVGTGDCGSCTAYTVRAAVILEEAGLPTVGVGTEIFAEQFHREAAQLGMADIPFVAVEHPLGGLRPDAVRKRAATVLQRLESALLNG